MNCAIHQKLLALNLMLRRAVPSQMISVKHGRARMVYLFNHQARAAIPAHSYPHRVIATLCQSIFLSHRLPNFSKSLLSSKQLFRS